MKDYVDTRTKILTAPRAVEIAGELRARGRTLLVVVAWFDPMIGAHALRMRELSNGGGAALMVILDTPAEALLPLAARAELAAGLAAVDYVVAPDGGVDALVERLQPDSVVIETADEAERRGRFVEYVARRAGGA